MQRIPKRIVFDKSKWPILLMIHPDDPVDDEGTQEYLKELKKVFDLKQEFCFLIDVNVAKPPTAEHRYQVAVWLRENKDLVRKYTVATAFIMSSLIQRMVLKTFLNFLDTEKIFRPVRVVSTYEDAFEWAQKKLRQSRERNLEGAALPKV
jgi:hypothetical protein